MVLHSIMLHSIMLWDPSPLSKKICLVVVVVIVVVVEDFEVDRSRN